MSARTIKLAGGAFLLGCVTVGSVMAQDEPVRQHYFSSGRTVGRDAMPRGSTPGVPGGATGIESSGAGPAGSSSGAGAGNAGGAASGNGVGGGSAGGAAGGGGAMGH